MRSLLSCLLALSLCIDATARPPRRSSWSSSTSSCSSCWSASSTPTSSGVVQCSAFASTAESTVASDVNAFDGLVEVNAARAARGLRPYLRDPALTQGALQAAIARARSRVAGHTANDFAFLPPGTSAAAAGCGALAPSWGWGSCCTYESHAYAGAAVAIGPDGRRYMHLFVR